MEYHVFHQNNLCFTKNNCFTKVTGVSPKNSFSNESTISSSFSKIARLSRLPKTRPSIKQQTEMKSFEQGI